MSRVRDIPTEIVVGADHGIDHRRAVSLDNVLTLSKRVLVERVGQLSDAEMLDACDALAVALGCS